MESTAVTSPGSIFPRAFWLAFGLNFIWINASEVFRYFAFVMPMMREAFVFVPNIAPMNMPVFMIWGIWDTILVFSTTFIAWLIFERFSPILKNALMAGTIIWATVFVILWLGLYNMSLATPAIMAVALPLAWIEMIIAALIVRWCYLYSG